MFINTLLFVVDNLLGFSLNDSAFALCLQLIDFCNYNDNDSEKPHVYLKIADICLRLNHFDMAITVLQKAVELCWIFEFRGLELVIYDMLGINYFRQGDLSRAKYFHNK